MLLLFILSAGYLLYRIRRGQESRGMLFLIIYSFTGLVIITYNPILPGFFNRFADDEYSFLRFAWIIPIYFMMAYGAMRAVMSFELRWQRAIALILVTVLVIAAGEPRPGIYLKAENDKKLDPEII
ncbi:MAG: hypothetical protein J6N76_04925, partial [Lachnospiraceae bacterium]|nr:hypothetical protein [Lachnospiraceae bacterium]